MPSVKSPAAQLQVRETIKTSVTVKREGEFAQHLENARKYREFSLDAAACREYFRAFENLPMSSRERVGKQVDDAKGDYDKGRFAEAAEKLENALKP